MNTTLHRWTSQTGYELIQKTIAGLQSGGAAAAIAQADFIVNHENEPEIEPYLHSAQSPIIPHQPLFPFFEETSMSRNDSITVRVSCETQFKQVSDTSTCAIRQRRLENDRFLVTQPILYICYKSVNAKSDPPPRHQGIVVY